MKKTYQAVVCGKPVDIVGNYVDYLLKDGKNNYSRVVDKSVEDSKRAELNYRVLAELSEAPETGLSQEKRVISLVEVQLLTGRHHQIRVQFAAHGTPLWGDSKYNPLWEGSRSSSLALWSVGLSFLHPVTGKRMEFSMKPKGEIFRRFEEETKE